MKYSKRNKKDRLMRERQKAPCAGCGKFFAEEELTLDHIVPKSKGGTLRNENLQLMCYPCNTEKDNDFELERIFELLEEERKRR